MSRMNGMRWIIEARKEQIEKWGDLHHSPIEWYAILGEEFGEVGRHITEMHFSKKENGGHYPKDTERINRYKKELAQTGAVILAMLEQIPE